MYEAKKAKKKALTIDYILSKTTEYAIYESYIGTFKVGAIYKSPLRKDKTPSFGIFWSKNKEKLLFKDHGTGACGDVFHFVSLHTGLIDIQDVLENIVERLNITSSMKLDQTKIYQPTGETEIGIVRQNFTKTDLAYWKQFNITETTLRKYNVFSIRYYLCNGIVKGIYKTEEPMYAYKIDDKFKIYRPLSNKYTKWRSNTTNNNIQGYSQLPKTGNLLIVTKSLKDIMCLHEMGIPAISPSSESTFIPNTSLEALSLRFKRILILFDRDGPGMKYSRLESLKTGLPAMFMHKSLHGKDISDCIIASGYEATKNWLYKTLHYESKSK